MSKDTWGYGVWPWAGISFGKGARFFESGEVRIAILSLLGEGPKHGYQLMKEMAERSGGLYKASAGSVYPSLQQLADEGLIKAGQKDGRRVVSLTALGRKELQKDSEGARRIWERAEKWGEWGQYMKPGAMPVMQPLSAMCKAAWKAAGRVAGSDGEERVREILDHARHELERL